MKIFITCPALSVPHGGIRIIIEWANRLTRWHEVYLHSLQKDQCKWMNINEKVHLVNSESMEGMDCLIITSPHSIDFEDKKDCPKKVFIFSQMAEHLFNTQDSWQKKCIRFYTSKHPMFSISKWNIEEFEKLGRTGKTHYIDNAINLEDFPISRKEKDGRTILIEGWEGYNPTKDTNNAGPQACKALKRDGYKIIAYSQFACTKFHSVPDEYYVKPSIELLNDLYERATILIKATKYDARSLSPLEAMSKGTVTARAIIKGDDDLIDGENCLKVPYSPVALYRAAEKLMVDSELRNRLSANCISFLEDNTWDKKINFINNVLES